MCILSDKQRYYYGTNRSASLNLARSLHDKLIVSHTRDFVTAP